MKKAWLLIQYRVDCLIDQYCNKKNPNPVPTYHPNGNIRERRFNRFSSPKIVGISPQGEITGTGTKYTTIYRFSETRKIISRELLIKTLNKKGRVEIGNQPTEKILYAYRPGKTILVNSQYQNA